MSPGFTILLLAGCVNSFEHTVAGGPNYVNPNTQITENKAVTNTDKPNTKSQKQNLVSGLFLESENDQDLKLIIEHWQTLSVELRSAIVKMVW